MDYSSLVTRRQFSLCFYNLEKDKWSIWRMENTETEIYQKKARTVNCPNDV